jgi:hypothetical protein
MSDLTPDNQDFTADQGVPPRRIIEVGDGQLHRWVDQAWAAIIEANDPERPEVMLHGNDLVRLSEGRLVPFNAASLRDRLSRVAAFVQTTTNGTTPKTPPKEVADALLSRTPDEFEDAPRIERITDVPLLLKDGTILDRPGYHPEHRIYYQPAEGLEDLRIPGPGEVEFVDEVVAARDFLLDEWFGEFGFADEASRTHALAAMLTPFVREYVPTGVPLFPIQAAQYGWGKTLTTDAAFVPVCGVPPKATGTDSEEEMRKRITSTLRGVPSVVVIDNYSGHLDSGALANVLTSGLWKDRILGESRDLIVQPRCVWSVNGNNFTMSGELVERCPAPIVLGPGAYWEALCERKGWDPTLRPREQPKSSYAHGDFRGWALAHRRDAIHAVFVLVRHWLDGRAEIVEGGQRFYRPALDDGLSDDERHVAPVLPDRDTGEFPEWQRVVGGILKASGVEGFGENYAAWSSTTDEEGEEIAEFFAAWRALDLGPIPLKKVAELCGYPGPLRDVLPTDLATARADALEPKLKAWLRDHKEQTHHGYRLIAVETARGRPNLYEVQARG